MHRFLYMGKRPKYKVEILGNEVTRRRLTKALSKADLAKLAGISESRLAKIETGLAGGVNTSTVNGLCRVLECEPQDISEVLEREVAS